MDIRWKRFVHQGKLTVQVHPSSLTDADTAQENANVAVTNFVTSIGWDSCGANMVEWVNKTQRSEPGSQADADEDEQSVDMKRRGSSTFAMTLPVRPSTFRTQHSSYGSSWHTFVTHHSVTAGGIW